jgi:hypothetical protein
VAVSISFGRRGLNQIQDKQILIANTWVGIYLRGILQRKLNKIQVDEELRKSLANNGFELVESQSPKLFNIFDAICLKKC